MTMWEWERKLSQKLSKMVVQISFLFVDLLLSCYILKTHRASIDDCVTHGPLSLIEMTYSHNFNHEVVIDWGRTASASIEDNQQESRAIT